MATTQATTMVTPADLFRIRTISEPQASPDGSVIAYTVGRADEKENRYRAAIWLSPTDGGDAVRLTSGVHRDGMVRWSPDGKTIAFTSDRNPDDKGKGQIWLVPVAGGEPTRLTSLDRPVEDFVWSPSGTQIALVSKVRHGEAPQNTDVRVITTIRFRFDGEGFLDDHYRQIFVVDVVDGQTRQLTDGPFEHTNPAWSPTGHEIAFSSNREEGWELSNNRDIYAIRPAGQDVRRVSDGTGNWRRPSWSPDGTTIACMGTRNLSSDAARTELFIVPAGGGSPESMSDGFDRSLADQGIGDSTFFADGGPRWAADGKSLLVVCSDEGSVQLARVAVPDGGVTLLTSGAHKVSSAAPLPDGRLALGIGTPTTAGDIWIRETDGTLSQLTHVGDEWADSVALSQPEEFRVASADGTMIHGWIMKPANFDPDTKYPMLLEIHGGPFGMYAEALMHEFQTLAARGYVVLYTNPRGSAGYGDEFAGSLFRGWGKNDMPDLMAAVDWAIEQGYVDPERLGILGGSYGGFMTNWVIGHTDRFKAAVTQRCLSDMYSTYGTDDIYFAMADQTIGGDPWEDPDIYWELSPITYVENIDTPLLIEHQEQDMRCPIGQAQQLFTALKRRGKIVEMMLYPDESHGMSRTGQPKHRIERLNAILDWFDRYL